MWYFLMYSIHVYVVVGYLSTILPCGRNEAHYKHNVTHIVFSSLSLLCLPFDGSWWWVDPWNLSRWRIFVMFWSRWRTETDANCAIKKKSEALSAMGFGFDISKLRAWYCVHHVKFIVGVKLMEVCDQDTKWNLLGRNTICQDYFYCCLIFLI